MKIIFTSLLLIFTCLFASAQTSDYIKANPQSYIWGEGKAASLKVADQYALEDIISQISIHVQSSFDHGITESGKSFEETVKAFVSTYSNVTLNNTERFVISNEPDAHVFRYIKRSEIDKVFELRKQKIVEFAKSGEEYLEKLQIADALRYFYWAQTLLRTQPNEDKINYSSKGNEVYLKTWLDKQILNILSNLKVSVTQTHIEDGIKFYQLQFLYDGKPVRNLDYSYWTGQDWTNIYSGKDGLGVAEMNVQTAKDELSLKIEFEFESEANIDFELKNVMEKISPKPYKSAYINTSKHLAATNNSTAATSDNTVSTDSQSASLDKADASTVTSNTNVPELNSMSLLSDTRKHEDIIAKVKKAIANKDFASVQNSFTKEGFDIFKKLMQYGNAKLIHTNTPLRYFQAGENVICRSIPMSFTFRNNTRTFVEDVNFTFDKNHKINNITFGLSKQAFEDIASKDRWSENVRFQLIGFMENYKTAFALKRIDYIESIFSEDALIIVGSMLKVNPNFENRIYMNQELVRYNRMTKAEYLKKLKHSFNSNEFINIRFADNDFKRAGPRNGKRT
ncbi:hypothetical protein MASR2M117_20580 [Paludibacter sp.]